MATFLIRLGLILLIGFSSLCCEEINPDILRQNMIDTYSNIDTYKADFIQNNYWEEIDVSLDSAGKIFFDNHNLKLEYNDPEGQFLILDSLMVTMYEPTSNQAIISSSAEIDIRPISLISKYWQDSFLISCDAFDDTTEIVMKTEFEETITFYVKDNWIIQLTYIDLDSNRVTYKFSKAEIDNPLPEHIFEIILPEDVNLLDTRE
jgi:outer membrane lipoprotein-sorting protein